jgi:uncharacterized protein GlcG (DUF336 family)
MRKLVLAAVFAGFAFHGASAQEDALYSVKMMTPETALTLAKKALEDCRANGFQVSVAVVDRSGMLQVLLRDRFAGPHTPETARRKAWTAISFKTETQAMSELMKEGSLEPGVGHVDGALIVGGGVRVLAGGSVVGGVGVSGAPSPVADEECARVGIEAVQADLEF